MVKAKYLTRFSTRSRSLPLFLAGEKGQVPQRVQATYAAMKRPGFVVSQAGSEAAAVLEAVPWLLGQ